MKGLLLILAGLAVMPSLHSAPLDAAHVKRVEALCRSYVEDFVSPSTNLAYGKRLNGPRGVAVLESPAEIAKLRVNGKSMPWGYGSGVADVAYQNGMFLYALCDAEEATGSPYLAELARQTFSGLKRVATLSPVPGFVPRGPHPDGKSYYPNSSLDQHSLFVAGLWRYARSRLATPGDKGFIRDAIGKILRRLEQNRWAILAEDGTEPHEGGTMADFSTKSTLLLMMLVSSAADATGDPHWREVYEQLGKENGGKRWQLLAQDVDRSREPRYTLFYNQTAFRNETLRRIESSPERRQILQRRTEQLAADMLSAPYLRAWRHNESVGKDTPDDEANAYLKPLGVTLTSGETVMDFWKKFDLDRQSPTGISRKRDRYETLTLGTPAMVWQVALLSRRPELVRSVQPTVREMLARVDFKRIDAGFTYNYAVLAALWSLGTSP